LLTFLDSPVDDQAFARFILGDIFAKSSGLSREDLHAFVLNVRQDGKTKLPSYLYKTFRRAYPEIWTRLLEPFFSNVGLTPLYELMISILGCYQVMNHFVEHQGYVMCFLELIKENEDEVPDLGSFLEYLEDLKSEDLYVNVSDSNAVRVLTVHKSKGLEFPVVVIPFLSMDIHVGAGGGFGQQSYILEQQDQFFELLRIKSKYLKFSEKLSGIWRRQYIQSLYSELNSVYVALTRAEKEMYVFIPKKVGSSFNFVNFLIPEDGLESGDKPKGSIKHSQEESSDLQTIQIPPSDFRDWIQILKEEFHDDGAGRNRDAVVKGQVIHAVLACVGNVFDLDSSEVIDQALNRAKTDFPFYQDWEEIRRVVGELLNKPALRKFFVVESAEVRQEIELVNAAGRTGRLDRLIIKDKQIWVLDYKSSHEGKEEYQQQVSQYMSTVQDVYPQHQVQGFILYLDDLTAEEVI